MRVVHVCGDLGLYGAENVVALLMQHPARARPRARRDDRQPVDPPRRGSASASGHRDRARRPQGRRLPLPDGAQDARGCGPTSSTPTATTAATGAGSPRVLAGVPLIVHTEHNPDLRRRRRARLPRRSTALLEPAHRGRSSTSPPRRREELAAAESIPLGADRGDPQRDPRSRRAARRARERARAALGAAARTRSRSSSSRGCCRRSARTSRSTRSARCSAEPRARGSCSSGDGPLRDELEALRARAAGSASAVRFLGFRDRRARAARRRRRRAAHVGATRRCRWR